MKSLGKALDILEYAVLQNGERVTPTRTANALGINLATCTRIMRELMKRDYLVQISRKDGYVPGPMIPSLSTRHNSYEQLASAARIPIEKLSEKLGCQVNFSVMHADRRIMLCYHLSRGEQKPWDHFIFSAHWETATGRLLIAALNEREARKLVSAAGVRAFPRKELEQIRQSRSILFRKGELAIMGRLILLPGYPAAAFGFGVPAELADKASTASEKTAAEIEDFLNQPNHAY